MNDRCLLAEKLDHMLPECLRLIIQKLLTCSPEEQPITLPQTYLLRQIYTRGPCTAATVGEILGVTSGPVTSMTSRLVKRGLLLRRRDEIDRRVVWFSLTSHGEEAVLELVKNRQKRWALLLEKLGPEKSATLVELIRDVEETLKTFP